MAFAIIEQINSTRTILEWNIINLLPEQPLCHISTCKKTPEYTCTHNGVDINWCEKHDIYSFLQKLSMENKDSNVLSKKTKTKIINCNTYPINEMRLNLFKQLDIYILPLLFKYNYVDYMLIELQPVKRNPKMKALSDSLQAWGFIRGMSDTKTIKYNVNYVNACNKLKEYKKELDEFEGKEKYNITKATGVDVVSKYLIDNNLLNWLEFLQLYKKKDDLCDALLQGFVWLDRNKY